MIGRNGDRAAERRPRRERRRLRSLLAASLLAGTGALGVVACGRNASGEQSPAAEIATVEKRDLNVEAEASGTIEPIRVVEVKSKASGEILKLHVDTGDKVAQGALLAEVDPRDVRNALDQAKADLAVAEANYDTKKEQREREQQLLAAKVVTEQEFESSKLDEATAQAQLVKARTNLQLAEERRGDVTIRAPLDGTIIEKDVEVGQIIASASNNISGGTTLLKMADLSEMQVRTLVDETDIGRIRAGQSATVTVEAYAGRRFVGTVLKIEPQAVLDQNVTMFPVLVRLDNREGLLNPGMNAEVTIEIANRPGVVAVPNAAVVSPRDAAAAAATLGLDPATLRSAFAGGPNGRNGDAAQAGGQRSGAASAAAAPASPGAAGTVASNGIPSECRGLREKMQAGSLSEADRALMEKCRAAFRAARGAGGGGADGAFGGAGSGASGAGAQVSESGVGVTPRPGIVFVSGAQGPEPRRVMLGLNDWDFTEVLRGLEPGDKVILMSVARMQQQQEELTNRIRQRASGPLGGSSGGRRGR